jgi:hypothetical protein
MTCQVLASIYWVLACFSSFKTYGGRAGKMAKGMGGQGIIDG